jgi:putative nucleotidyltransferase with HDIG domain
VKFSTNCIMATHGYDRTVRGLEGVVNTVRRTVIAFFPVFAAPDDAFAARFLSKVEFGLYRGMDARDRLHACAVTRQLLRRYPEASDELRRAALLHDVGKASTRYSPWLRVLVALYTPRSVAAEPRLRGLQGAWQLKRHHDRYGAAQILAAGGDRRVAELVARHHRPGGDLEAARLREIDARF